MLISIKLHGIEFFFGAVSFNVHALNSYYVPGIGNRIVNNSIKESCPPRTYILDSRNKQ